MMSCFEAGRPVVDSGLKVNAAAVVMLAMRAERPAVQSMCESVLPSALGQRAWRSFNVVIFLDTMNVMNVKLCTVALLI